MIVSKKMQPNFDLRIRDMRIKQAHKFNYLGIVVIDDGKCDKEIQMYIGIPNDTAQKLNIK